MYKEEFEEERFHVNRGRDAFIDRIMSIPDPITESEIEEISELLEHL